jgi:hypothetical protein
MEPAADEIAPRARISHQAAGTGTSSVTRPGRLAQAVPACLLSAVFAVIVLFACLCGSALAAQSVRLDVALSPEHLGRPTTIFFGFVVSSPAPGSPVPVTNVGVLLPDEMGVAASGLGLENCVPFRLEEYGPQGCPPDSLMGRGVATVQVPIAGESLSESGRVELFSAPVVDGRFALLVYTDAISPISAQLVFPSAVLPAVAPYGEDIDTNLPLVPSLPDGPDVAVTSFHASLGSVPGPDRFVYYRSAHGKRVSFAPRGLILPASCPRGGFPFEAQFSFQDLSHATARTTVPCPRGARRLGRDEHG